MKALKQITTTLALLFLMGVFFTSCQKDEEMLNPANQDQVGLEDASFRTFQSNHTNNNDPSQANLGGNDPLPGGGGGDPLIKDGDDTEDDDDDDQIKDGDDTEDDDDDDSSFLIIHKHSNFPAAHSSQ